MEEKEPRKEVIIEREQKSHGGWIVGVIVIVLLIVVAIYGLPYITGGNNSSTEVEVNPTQAVPATGAEQ